MVADEHPVDPRRVEERLQVLGFAIPVDRHHVGREREVVAPLQPPEMDVGVNDHGRSSALAASLQ